MIDSWAWIEYFQGTDAGKRAQAFVEGEEPAVISPANLAEVWKWFLRRRSLPEAEMARRLMVRRCAVVDFTAALAVDVASAGATYNLGFADSVIYATARKADARVLTGDPDFEAFPDVEYIGQKRQRPKA